MMFAFIVFLISLVGIIALFTVKYWELNREHVLWPRLRTRVDVRAQQAKELLGAARADMAKLPLIGMRTARFLVHEAALGFAALARAAETAAHRVAEMVSHKRTFQQRETRSEFLKQVSEFKNGNGLDTTNESGQNS